VASVGKDVDQLEHSCLSVGLENGAAALEKSVSFSKG